MLLFRQRPEKKFLNAEFRNPAKAGIHIHIDSNNILHARIKHEVLQEITPAMIKWWYENLDGYMAMQNSIYTRYHMWHPLDHMNLRIIKTSIYGDTGVGAIYKTTERIGCRKKQTLITKDQVIRLDESGMVVVKSIFGYPVMRLENTFDTTANGTRMTSDITIGLKNNLKQIITGKLRPGLDRDTAMGFLKHHVEEIGHLENFLPELYQYKRTKLTKLNLITK